MNNRRQDLRVARPFIVEPLSDDEIATENAPEYLFDQHWEPRSERLKADIAEIINRLQIYERLFHLRKRVRKPVDQGSFEKIVAAIVCGLIHRELTEPNGWLSLSLSHRDVATESIYSTFSLGNKLSDILKLMSYTEMGFLQLRLGKQRKFNEDAQVVEEGKLTTIRSRDILKNWIYEKPYSLADLKRSANEQVIILKAGKEWRNDAGEWVEYNDTPQIVQWRAELRDVNAWLNGAAIDYVGHERIDSSRRTLRRYFNNRSFEEGGRLFGGFWQDLPKQEREQNLRIQGEPIADLDYSNSGMRLLYALNNEPIQFDDAYRIPDFPFDMREGIKTLINAALSTPKRQQRFPPNTRKFFPKKSKYSDIWEAIERYHRPVAANFFVGIGMKLQFYESEVLMRALHLLKQEGIVSLPMHDGVMTAFSHRERARELLLQSFLDVMGATTVVKQKYP